MLAHLDVTNHNSLAAVEFSLDVEKLLDISRLLAGSGTLINQKVLKFLSE